MADIAVPEEPVIEALTNCDFVLTDQGDSLGDATRIVVAAEKLEQFGEVRIRVFDQTASGSLDDELASMAVECGWLDDGGDYNANFLVFGVSIGDRATRVLYGSEWGPALDDSASVIIDRVVNAQFAQENYQGGLIGGVEQFASLRADADANGAAVDSGGAEGADSEEPVLELDQPDGSAGEAEGAAIVADELDDLDQSVEVPPVPTVESQGSKVGIYALIAGVLVAVTVLPAIFLRRSRNDADSAHKPVAASEGQ